MKEIPVYLDEKRSFEERAADLVSRMTLEEKAAQLKNEAAAIPRLGVREYNYWREGLHGVARQGKAASFPTSLAMANTWNPELVRRAAEVTSDEARAKNPVTNLSYWSPTINMARDPRWGRNEETYGEDPYLTFRLGSEFVRGMQGDDEKYIKTIATLKHFIANNNEKERRIGSSVMDEATLRDYYARAFQDIVEAAHPGSVMSSYNATTLYRNGEVLYDYIPSTANPYILKDLLRRSWGFDGYVTGDCGAFEDLDKTRAYKAALFPGENIDDVAQSATIVKGFLSGADTDCGSAAAASSVLDAVRRGYITEEELTVNVYNLFLQRMRTGEFDRSPAFRGIRPDILEAPEHVALAEEAAEQSWVLLKNSGILPLAPETSRVVLAGPLADSVVLGDYSGSPENTVTPYRGIAAELNVLNPGAELSFPGVVTDETSLMDIDALWLVFKDGSRRRIDLSAAEAVAGMEVGDGLRNVTRRGSAVIRNVDLSGVAYISAVASAEGRVGGTIKLFYGSGGPQVAEIRVVKGASAAEGMGEYTGEAGGYCGTADLCLGFEAGLERFSVERYRRELDEADVIIAYAGTTLSDSAEFNDRTNIALPASQSHVQALVRAYPEKTVVALQTVGQIDVSPFEDAAAILWTSYNGQTQGTALGRVLTGRAEVSGRLTTTWYRPEDLELMPFATEGITGADGIVRYRSSYNIRPEEGFPGRTYMYYRNKPVYPFGYGLSYTEFEYGELCVSAEAAAPGDSIELTVNVRNSGMRSGTEVVQFYACLPGEYGRRLIGFDRVTLKPGEMRPVSAEVKIDSLRVFDEANQRTRVIPGEYKMYAGKNADDSRNARRVKIGGELSGGLKRVRALPDGITVRGMIEEGAECSEPISVINPNVSVVTADERLIFPDPAEISFESSDESVALIRAGQVVSGRRSGTATIRASVTYGGVTGTASFPVCCRLELKARALDRSLAAERVRAYMNMLPREMYSAERYAELLSVLDEGLKKIESAVLKYELSGTVAEIERSISGIEPDRAAPGLEIEIGGLAPGAGEIGRSGAYPLRALRDGAETEAVWRVACIGGRSCAELSESGELQVDGSGVFIVRAFDTEHRLSGERLINANLGYDCRGFEPWAANRLDGIYLRGLERLELDYTADRRTTASAASDEKSAPGSVFASAVLEPGSGTAVLKAERCAEKLCGAEKNGAGTIYIKLNGASASAMRPVYGSPEESEAALQGGGTTVIYSADDPAYDAMFTNESGVKLPEINGLTGYGIMREYYGKFSLEHNGQIRRAWQGVRGSESECCLFFMPRAACTVTVLFDGLGDNRVQYIVQNSTILASELVIPGTISEVSARITDTSAPVYIYGGDKNKSVYDIIVRYDVPIAQEERTVQSLIRPGGFARIVKYAAGQGGCVEFSDTGRVWQRIDLSFAGSPNVNSIAVYKDRVYAGCSGGLVIVIGDCPKCRAAHRAVDFDIDRIEISDGIMRITGGGASREISMAALGADSVTRIEAEMMISRGAAVIDVREEYEFMSEPSAISGAVNIPLAELERISQYDRGGAIIFCCKYGIMSAEAVLRAKEMGFERVYSLERDQEPRS